MWIRSIYLSRYRNILKAQLFFHPRLNIFIGSNGQGKTNLLESIAVGLNGASFRSTAGAASFPMLESLSDAGGLEPLWPDGLSFEGTALVKMDFVANDLPHKLEVRWKEGKKRQTRPSVKRALAFTPESLSLVKQGASERRAFVDDVVGILPSSYALSHTPPHGIVEAFAKCLKNKNALLKALKQKGPHADMELLLAEINGKFAQLATQLSLLRIEALKQLQPLYQEACREVFFGKKVDTYVDYLVSSRSVLDLPKAGVKELILGRLEELKNLEQSVGYSLAGPHRHDVSLMFNGENARFYCSQGQQRALTLALKLAQKALLNKLKAVQPVFLLDDVFSELDSKRRNWLVDFLTNSSEQVFITTTDSDLPGNFAKSQAKGEGFVFQVKQGAFEKRPYAE